MGYKQNSTSRMKWYRLRPWEHEAANEPQVFSPILRRTRNGAGFGSQGRNFPLAIALGHHTCKLAPEAKSCIPALSELWPNGMNKISLKSCITGIGTQSLVSDTPRLRKWDNSPQGTPPPGAWLSLSFTLEFGKEKPFLLPRTREAWTMEA
jgi:hypothetical protein